MYSQIHLTRQPERQIMAPQGKPPYYIITSAKKNEQNTSCIKKEIIYIYIAINGKPAKTCGLDRRRGSFSEAKILVHP